MPKIKSLKKCALMANIVFNLIWNDKEKIISIANDLIDKSIKTVHTMML